MSSALYLMPTAVPGLSLARGHQQIIHDATGLCVATLPPGLSRFEATGLRGESRRASPLEALAVIDWQGPLSAAHQTVLNAVTPHYASAEAARACGARLDGIHAGLRLLTEMMRGTRGKQMDAAFMALKRAREARAEAVTPAEKGQATRLEKAAQAALDGCGLNTVQMDRLSNPKDRPRLWMAGMNRVSNQRQTVTMQRSRHLGDCQRLARRFLDRHEDAGVVGELRLCLMMTSPLSGTANAAFGRPRRRSSDDDTVQPTYLKTANAERVRRTQAAEALTPAHPSVRALTRPARLSAAAQRTRLNNEAIKRLERVCAAFTAAARFKTRPVRLNHYQAACDALSETYPAAGQQRSVARAVRRELLGPQHYGLPPVTLSEIPLFTRQKTVMPTLL